MNLTTPAGGYSDSEARGLITVAGQRRTCTELSPLPLVAAPHQNQPVDLIVHLDARSWHNLAMPVIEKKPATGAVQNVETHICRDA